VLGQPRGRCAASLEQLCQLPVERAPPGPGDVAVERLADQRMPEPGRAGGDLDQQPLPERLAQGVLAAGERRHDVQVEARARRRGDLQGRSRGVAQSGRAQQHQITYGVGHGQPVRVVQMPGAAAFTKPPCPGQRRQQLLDEERQPVAPLVQEGGQRRRGRTTKELRREGGRFGGTERLDGELPQLAGAAQLRPQPPQRVVAAQLVGAVRPEEE
jgi:hypothetical protein